jgi:hypothetical protein
MLDCPEPGQSATGMKKMPMSEQVRYWNKETDFGIRILRYWIEIMNAKMPMPEAPASMLMPVMLYRREN